eukprot:859068-Rhodomonas_salina.2
MTSISGADKVLVFDGTDEGWFKYSKKVKSIASSFGVFFILQIAESNNATVRERGLESFAEWVLEQEEAEAEKRTSPRVMVQADDGSVTGEGAPSVATDGEEPVLREYHFLSDDADGDLLPTLHTRKLRTLYNKAQTRIYNMINMGIVDTLSDVADKVDEDERECGTKLWEALLQRFASSKKIAKTRIIMDVVSVAQSITDGPWIPQSANLKRLIASYMHTGTPLTIDEVVFALVVQSFLRSEQYRSLGTSMLNEDEMDFKSLDLKATALDQT